jgi:AraC-like DNA-binding protein
VSVGLVLDRWTADPGPARKAVILPDGCRDIILSVGEGAEVFVSPLDLAARVVPGRAGVRMTGHRLRPGAWLAPADLEEALRSRPDDPEGAVALMLQAVQSDAEADAAIDGLAGGTPLPRVARHLGVSPRQVQRRLAGLGLPVPGFWALLGRARRAALMLAGEEPLSGIAAEAGYADQPHMTRDFGRFFGTTPAGLRADPGLQRLIREPGLATETDRVRQS